MFVHNFNFYLFFFVMGERGKQKVIMMERRFKPMRTPYGTYGIWDCKKQQWVGNKGPIESYNIEPMIVLAEDYEENGLPWEWDETQ